MSQEVLSVLSFVYAMSWFALPARLRRNPKSCLYWTVGLQSVGIWFGFVATGYLEFCAALTLILGCACAISLFFLAPLIDVFAALLDRAVVLVGAALFLAACWFVLHGLPATLCVGSFTLLFIASMAYWLGAWPEKKAARCASIASIPLGLALVSTSATGLAFIVIVAGGATAVLAARTDDQCIRADYS